MPAIEHLYFFEGIDPAPSESHRSDDGAMVIGAARPRRLPEKGEALSQNPGDWFFDLVYGRRLTAKEKASARQYSGIIHTHQLNFGLEKICMDPNGGGVYVKRELISPKQLIGGIETDVTPIGDHVDGPFKVVHGRFNLHMFKRGDPGIESLWPELAGDDLLNDALYSAFKDGLEHAIIGLPATIDEWLLERKEEIRAWPEERTWALKNLTAFVSQAKNIMAATREDGTYAMTKRGARQFAALGKKDLVSAAMYAYCAFLIWLRSDDFCSPIAEEDAAGFCGRVRN